MLSRVAASLYWLSRYVERSDGILRMLKINYASSQDTVQEFTWEPVIRIFSGHDEETEKLGNDSRAVIRYDDLIGGRYLALEEGPGSTDKPLGDAGSGASGAGSLGNQPGPGAATGGDPAQGVRQPTSGETEKSPAQHRPKQEIPPESGNGTESSGNDDALKRG